AADVHRQGDDRLGPRPPRARTPPRRRSPRRADLALPRRLHARRRALPHVPPRALAHPGRPERSAFGGDRAPQGRLDHESPSRQRPAVHRRRRLRRGRADLERPGRRLAQRPPRHPHRPRGAPRVDSAAMPSSLPWSWYSDPDVLRREQERIFRRAWQYVGHTGRVPNVGDRFAAWAGEIPVLVVRAEDGVRAFLNVCRHRGSLLVDGEGTGKSVQCPYHAWTYDLDGTLRAAPRSDREPDFDPEGLSLVSMRTEAWGPFLFVNPDEDAPPLDDTL